MLLSDSDEEEQQDEVEPEEVSALPSVVPSPQITSGGSLGILGTEDVVPSPPHWQGWIADPYISIMQVPGLS